VFPGLEAVEADATDVTEARPALEAKRASEARTVRVKVLMASLSGSAFWSVVRYSLSIGQVEQLLSGAPGNGGK
jgi:hypothetical protein